MKKIIPALILSLSSFLSWSQCIDPQLIDQGIVCPAIFAPVCGCDSITYGNDCEATYWNGVTWYYNGPCSGPQACNADFTMSTNSGSAPLNIQFNSASTGFAPISCTWDFGDGNQGTGNSLAYSFNTAGNYQVCLTIVDANGCSSTYCDSVFVSSGVICNPGFTYNINGNSVFFSFTGSVGGCNWEWIFNGVHVFQQDTITHVFPGAGSYVVCVQGFGGCSSCIYCDTLDILSSIPDLFNYKDRISIFPNPASGQATINFYIEQNGPVTINLYDMQGRKIQLLLHKEMGEGFYTSQFDPTALMEGFYMLKFETARSVHSVKFIKQ